MKNNLHLQLHSKFDKSSFTENEKKIMVNIFGLVAKDVYFEIKVNETITKDKKFINFYGSSGEGKTVIKDLIKDQLIQMNEKVFDFDDLSAFFEDNNERTIIEIFNIKEKNDDVIKILSYFGLFEMRVLLEKLKNLSTGQRTRMKYVYLMYNAIKVPGSFILIDEFVTFIDSLSGINFARGIRKFLESKDITLFTFGINDNILGQFEDISYMVVNGKISAIIENGEVTYNSKNMAYNNTKKVKLKEKVHLDEW